MSDGFKNLGLTDLLLRSVAKNGYDSPTPIQEKAIPLILQGKDLKAAAQTGTGKTAAYTLPLLCEIQNHPTDYINLCPRILILTPTRELASQVYESIKSLENGMNLRVVLVYGGVGINPQKKALSKGVDFLVATPGRLIDLMSQRAVSLANVKTLVLDEADRMLDMGFMPSIKRILAKLPAQRQTLLFSATFSAATDQLSQKILQNPVSVEVSKNSTAELIRQTFYRAPKSAKSDIIRDLVVDNGWKQVLIFTRTRHGADKLCKQLIRDGFLAKAIHGDKTQNQRSMALQEFKDGRLPILVATDVAARGLDIEKLPQVVNYELPEQTEDYIHRVGRVGRAGTTGQAFTLVSSEDKPKLKELEKLLKRNIEISEFPGFNYENHNEDRNSSAENVKKKHNLHSFKAKSNGKSIKNYSTATKMNGSRKRSPRKS